MSRTLALVPAKPLDESKTRLAEILSDAERRALSARLLQGVLSALGEAETVDGCWVVGGDRNVEGMAERYGARWLPELGDGLNDTIQRALGRLPDAVTHVLILPMDLPFLTGEAVDALVARVAESRVDVVIASDRWERGTNALLLGRPFALPLAFGPNSFRRHRAAAESKGLRAALHFARELAFDLDTPSDLAESGLTAPRESPPDA